MPYPCWAASKLVVLSANDDNRNGSDMAVVAEPETLHRGDLEETCLSEFVSTMFCVFVFRGLFETSQWCKSTRTSGKLINRIAQNL